MTVDAVEETGADVWVSIAELARLNGVSKQAVSKRVKRFEDAGQLTVRKNGRERHVNAAVYARLVKDTTDPAQALRNPDHTLSTGALPETQTGTEDAGAGGDEDQPAQSDSDNGAPRQSYSDAKARRAEIDAEIAWLDYQERIGNLISRDEADAKQFETFRRIRDRLMGLPATCAELLAAAPDARAIRVMLSDEIRKALDESADFLEEEEDDSGNDED
ncbi:winged helix-turn-helix domain-containing protein [Roseibium sediminicola]|uniref:Winged helix-turn-helix domain-containing protein n=1 Tax=Roseibium sediminicola TaxID=2933272 RepID=A0ABT0H0I9_9HYPH|nr:winged helix-turn-helix domain-containing protein [Roseibium sp. CAU 1639]MCK7615194.1 winged helix-turn-helix domain-containing protein [Roseibium sp. CAU 1639]